MKQCFKVDCHIFVVHLLHIVTCSISYLELIISGTSFDWDSAVYFVHTQMFSNSRLE
jgi:hypothetical protein